MILMQGKGVSKGVANGPIYFYQRAEATIVSTTTSNLAEEKRRLEEAKEKSMAQLSALADKAREEAGDETAMLFETHAMFVEDEDFCDCMDTALEEGNTAEGAVETAGKQFAAMLAAMDDAYMQARVADIKDVARRILNNLLGVAEEGIDSENPVILAADDLAPSETLQLDKSKILGFITQGGSSNSHTAILARTMGIPAICGLGDQLKAELNGRMAYVDGETGKVAIDPDEITLTAFQAKLEKQQELKNLMETMKGQEDVTLDGRHMMVYCNIGSPEDVAAVLSNDGQGIGLFRSEFLYLAASDYPSEEEQFQAYKEVAAAMEDKRVVIRTLDIGADKQVGYFDLQREENPALGVRAIRVCLNRPEVFRTQLRALYRASAYGKVAIMFPKEPTTLKELSASLGKETIDTFNTGESRGREVSHSLNYQKLGKALMDVDELAVLDGGKCILQLRGVRPFLSDKFDITRHPNYKFLADCDKKNAFDLERFLSTKLKPKSTEVYDVYEVDVSEDADPADPE